jgi:hypothetical protein
MSATFLHFARWTAPTSQIVALRIRCVIHQLEWLRTGLKFMVAAQPAQITPAAETTHPIRSSIRTIEASHTSQDLADED